MYSHPILFKVAVSVYLYICQGRVAPARPSNAAAPALRETWWVVGGERGRAGGHTRTTRVAPHSGLGREATLVSLISNKRLCQMLETCTIFFL